MLSALEARLGAPATAYSTLVFYQLRALWAEGRELIGQFGADVVRQQEDSERRMHLAEHNRRIFEEREPLEAARQAMEAAAAQAQQHLAQLRLARERLNRFWHYFKRRDVDRRLALADASAARCEQDLAAARTALEALEQRPVPRFPGLSVAARRAVNLAAIAYAEVLCLRLVDTPLTAMAKEAVARREAAEEYGDRATCEALMAQIERGIAALHANKDVAREVQARSEQLRSIARYRGDGDVLPVPDSIQLSERDVLGGKALGMSVKRIPNVLAEDTWELFRALLR
jgi:hypothetical protein